MELAIKIIEAIVPIIIEIIKVHHPDKTDDEHKKIVNDLIIDRLKK